jgi:hypothetical protein
MSGLLRSNCLRHARTSGLVLALALVANPARAGDIEWRAASPTTPPPADRGPIITIGAPVPLPSGPAQVVFRAQMADSPKMMPTGMPDGPSDPPAKQMTPMFSAPKPVPVLTGPAPAPVCDGCACNPCGCGSVDGCCGAFNDACCGAPRNCLWFNGEYLMWWMRGVRLPPLVTTGSPSDAIPGALGQPNTRVLFGGGGTVDDGMRSGARLSGGWWCDDEHTLGIELGGFFLAQRGVNFFNGSPGSPALFRPFFNSGFAFNPDTGFFVPITPSEDAEQVAFPGVLAGNIAVRLQTQLWGYEANLRTNLLNGCCGCFSYSMDGYTGFRGLGLDEKLSIAENLTSLLPDMPGSISVADRFRTQNRFYGGQIGLDSELRWGRLFLDVNGRLALGDVVQIVDIQGQTITTDALGGVITSRGGLLALNSNIGHYDRNRFAFLPEISFNVGYRVCDWMRLFVGYNFLYLSSVVRAPDQINRVVNPTGIPLNGSSVLGTPEPTFAFHGTNFYAQGINFGLQFYW